MKSYTSPPPLAKSVLPLLLLALLFSQAPPAEGKTSSIALSSAGRLDAASPQVGLAFSAARGMGMDWVILEIDWSALPAPSGGTYDLQALAGTLRQAERAGLKVALALYNAPDWAMSPSGPDPQAAAEVVRQLTALSPSGIQAVELFPEPNTSAGWGAQPDAAAYAALLHVVHTTLQQEARPVMLVTGGLALAPAASEESIPDLDFLQSLYALGAASEIDAVGISYPVFDPAANDPEDPQGLLRHYQEVRLLMLRNGHKEAPLWITRLAWKTGVSEAIQQRWLNAAYHLIQQQVYIGLVAFDGLAPPPERPLTVVDATGNLTIQFDVVSDAIAGYQQPQTWASFVRQVLRGVLRKQSLNKGR